MPLMGVLYAYKVILNHSVSIPQQNTFQGFFAFERNNRGHNPPLVM